MASALRSRQAVLKLLVPLQKPPYARFMSTGISHKLFIGGLSWSTDEHSLRDAFSSYGEISEVKVVQDRETGRSKGFGFVSFMSTEDAESAKNGMDGKNLNGRTVRVDFAIEKPPSARTFGGFDASYSDSTFGGNASQSYSSVSTSSASSLHGSTLTQASPSSFGGASYSSDDFKSDEGNVSSGNMSKDSFDTSCRRDNAFESDEDDVPLGKNSFDNDVFNSGSFGDDYGKSSFAHEDKSFENTFEDDAFEDYAARKSKY